MHVTTLFPPGCYALADDDSAGTEGVDRTLLLKSQAKARSLLHAVVGITARQPGRPMRQAQQHGSDTPSRPPPQQAATRGPAEAPTRGTRRGSGAALPGVLHITRVEEAPAVFCARRSFLQLLLAARCLVRLSRLTVKMYALRDIPSPGKRRLSPPPEVAAGPIRLWSDTDAAVLVEPTVEPTAGKPRCTRYYCARKL